MRHTFRFPRHIRDAVRSHVRRAISQVSPQRFGQEPAYVTALANRLEGTAYSGPDGEVTFRSTSVNSIGRQAAESLTGADFVLTAKISGPNTAIDKAILVQAKLNAIEQLRPEQILDLYRQIALMKVHTRSPKIMEIVERDGLREPRIISANRMFEGERYTPIPMDDYIVRRILPTLDGDTRPSFVSAVQDSGLARLRMIAALTP